MRSLVFVPSIYAGASGAQCRLTAVIPLLLAIFFSSIARSQTVIPPATSWRIKSTSYCDFNTQYDFISPWPGDSPIDVLRDYVAFLDGKCGGSAGGNLIVTHTLNACTPTIDVVSNGTNPAAAGIARYCTYRRHVDPKPGCTPAWACQPYVEERSAPQPVKQCVLSSAGMGNGAHFTLTSPPSYGECMCPAATEWVEETSMCLAVIDRTQKPPDMCTGNPIFPGTGNKRQTDIDYRGTAAFPLAFSRTYHSDPAFGQGWRGAYDRYITYKSVNGTAAAIIHRPEGSYPFRANGGSWVADADVQYKLSGSNGSFQVTTPEGRQREFYNPSNKLLTVRNAVNTIEYALTYSTTSTPPTVAPAAGLLIQVTDPFGHALNFTYDTQRRLATMTDPGGGLYQYGYTAPGNLSTVTYPDGTTRQYVYNEPWLTAGASLPRALTGIFDETATRYATFGYTANGLAVLTEHAGGADRHQIAYVSEPTLAREFIRDAANTIKYVVRYYQAPPFVVVTDALGESRQYAFLNNNGTVRATGSDKPGNGSCSAIPLARTLDANGNIGSSRDFNGHTSNHVYDLSRNLETSRTEAAGASLARTITTQWHGSFSLPTLTSTYNAATASGTPVQRTGYTYNTLGNSLTRTETDPVLNVSRTSTYTYNSFGQVLTTNGPRTDVSDVTTYTYYNCTTGYQCGQVQSITHALNHTTTYNTYNAHGQPLTLSDPNGVVTTLTYDLRQRLTSRTVDSESTTFEYWPTGLLKKATLPDGSYLEYSYDGAHRLIAINDAEGNRIAYTLDAMGNRASEEVFDPSNALTRTRTRVFNTLNQLSKEIGAANSTAVTTTFSYDQNGNQTTVNAPLSRNSTHSYDELNRLMQVTDPTSGATRYAYNALDQLISVTDPKNKVTSYSYNALGDLTQQTSPDTGTTTNTYDSAGNLKTSTDARNKTGTYAYDALNRVTSLTYPDQTISYSYDQGTSQKGRLTQLSDNSGSTSWSYDPRGRVTSRQQSMSGVTKTFSSTYDLSGRLQSLTLPSGNQVSYGYTNGKATSLTLNGSTLILNNVLYQPFGPAQGWTWGNGTLAVREYDSDGKVTDIDSAGLKTYSYDDAFRITGITDTSNPNLSQSYGYDLLDRITSATGTSLNQGWTYDLNGNRLAQSGSQASTYTVSTTSNRVNNVSGSLTKTYTYDAAGNITSDGTATFTYNDAGRMISATKASITSTYSLNGLGQRVKKTTSGTSTYFVYDDAGHLIGEYDASGNLIQETIWLGDVPAGTLKPDGSGGVTLFYVHTDHLNTPRRITRPSDNQIVWRWDSDPFGTIAANQDPDGDSNLFVYDLRFPGQYYDSETGLHYNYFRDYDPAIGRYVQSDPIGLDGGLNTYAYVSGDPISYLDPTGENPLWGALTGAGLDVAIQLMTNGGRFECIKWDVVAIAAFTGAVNPFAATSGISKLLKGEKMAARAGNLRAGSRAARRTGQRAAKHYSRAGREFASWVAVEGTAEGIGNLIPDDKHWRLNSDECDSDPCK